MCWCACRSMGGRASFAGISPPSRGLSTTSHAGDPPTPHYPQSCRSSATGDAPALGCVATAGRCSGSSGSSSGAPARGAQAAGSGRGGAWQGPPHVVEQQQWHAWGGRGGQASGVAPAQPRALCGSVCGRLSGEGGGGGWEEGGGGSRGEVEGCWSSGGDEPGSLGSGQQAAWQDPERDLSGNMGPHVWCSREGALMYDEAFRDADDVVAARAAQDPAQFMVSDLLHSLVEPPQPAATAREQLQAQPQQSGPPSSPFQASHWPEAAARRPHQLCPSMQGVQPAPYTQPSTSTCTSAPSIASKSSKESIVPPTSQHPASAPSQTARVADSPRPPLQAHALRPPPTHFAPAHSTAAGHRAHAPATHSNTASLADAQLLGGTAAGEGMVPLNLGVCVHFFALLCERERG